MKFLAVLFGSIVGAICVAQIHTDVDRIIRLDSRYYYVTPARQLVFGAVSNVSASSDGRYLVYAYDPNQIYHPSYEPGSIGTYSLAKTEDKFREKIQAAGIYLYDINNSTQTRLMPILDGDAITTDAEFIYGTHSLLLTTREGDSSHQRIFDITTRKTRELPIPADSEISWMAYVSSTLTYVAGGSDADSYFTLLLDSSFQVKAKLAEGFAGSTDNIDIQGSRLGIGYNVLDTATGRIGVQEPSTAHLFETDLMDTQLLIADPKTLYDQSGFVDLNELYYVVEKVAFGGGRLGRRDDLWVHGVGGLYLVDLRPVSAAEYEANAERTIKMKAIMQAKQVSTAILIYSTDYDDFFPPVSGWTDRVNPYIRNSELMEGFTYLLNGQEGSKIENPSTTPMGQVDTPYGTAVAYADGSVKWIPRGATAASDRRAYDCS